MKDVSIRRNKGYNSINVTKVTNESLVKANELYQAQNGYPTIIKVKVKALLEVTADLDLAQDEFEVLGSRFKVLSRNSINGALIENAGQRFESQNLRIDLTCEAITAKVPAYLGYIYP